MSEGAESPSFQLIDASVTRLANGGLQIDLSVFEMQTVDNSVTAYLYALCLYASSTSDYSDYSEIYIFLDGSGEVINPHSVGESDEISNFGTWVNNGDGTYTITFSAEVVAWFETNYASFANLGVDLHVYYNIPSLGIDYDDYFTSVSMDDIPAIPAP